MVSSTFVPLGDFFFRCLRPSFFEPTKLWLALADCKLWLARSGWLDVRLGFGQANKILMEHPHEGFFEVQGTKNQARQIGPVVPDLVLEGARAPQLSLSTHEKMKNMSPRQNSCFEGGPLLFGHCSPWIPWKLWKPRKPLIPWLPWKPWIPWKPWKPWKRWKVCWDWGSLGQLRKRLSRAFLNFSQQGHV